MENTLTHTEQTASYAFADTLLALDELGHQDVAERLAQRWADVQLPTAAGARAAAAAPIAPRFLFEAHTS